MSLKQPLQVLSLSPSGNLLAVAYGYVIQIVDTASGKLKFTTSKEQSHKPGSIVRHLIWWEDSKLVSSAEDKIVKEWEVEFDTDTVQLVFKWQRDIPKRANAISITKDGQALVIADKFGDVYAFPMHGCNPHLPTPPRASFPSEPSTSAIPAGVASSPSNEGPFFPTTGAAKPPKSRHKASKVGILKNPLKGPDWRHVPARVSPLTPVLGHVSMLTAMLIQEESEEGRIITADRDEHIRVSKWPDGWLIEGFLLGQRKFVSAMAIHPSNSDILLSAGGDDSLRVWSLSKLICLSKSLSLEGLKGTAEVKVEIEATKMGKRMRRKMDRIQKNKKKTKADQCASEDVQDGGSDESGLDVPSENGGEHPKEPHVGRSRTKKLDLAIRKMLFVAFGRDREDEDSLLVLSSVGSTALLAYRTSDLMTWISETGEVPKPQLLKLDYPVLDITAIPSKRHLWISLDISTSVETDPIKCYEVSGDGLLISTRHATLKALNEECSTSVSDSDPYPSTTQLYPEISLLSKESSDDREGRKAEEGPDDKSDDDEGGDDPDFSMKGLHA